MSFLVDTYISPIMIRVCMNTARSKGQGKKKRRRFLERSNEIMEFSINTAWSKCQQNTPPFSGTIERRGSNRFKLVQTGAKRFKPVQTQEKCASSAVATDYMNRAATTIAITTVLRSLHSTSIQHHSHAATHRDAATVAVHQVLQVSVTYFLYLYEC